LLQGFYEPDALSVAQTTTVQEEVQKALKLNLQFIRCNFHKNSGNWACGLGCD